MRGHSTTRHTSSVEEDVTDLITKTKAFRRAETALEERRLALAKSIWMASFRGMRQAEIVRITGYTREHIRRIVRDRMSEIDDDHAARGLPSPWEF